MSQYLEIAEIVLISLMQRTIYKTCKAAKEQRGLAQRLPNCRDISCKPARLDHAGPCWTNMLHPRHFPGTNQFGMTGVLPVVSLDRSDVHFKTLVQHGPTGFEERTRNWGVQDYCQWIGLRENLQENPIFNGKIYGFL